MIYHGTTTDRAISIANRGAILSGRKWHDNGGTDHPMLLPIVYVVIDDPRKCRQYAFDEISGFHQNKGILRGGIILGLELPPEENLIPRIHQTGSDFIIQDELPLTTLKELHLSKTAWKHVSEIKEAFRDCDVEYFGFI